jgi:hypothetical protein
MHYRSPPISITTVVLLYYITTFIFPFVFSPVIIPISYALNKKYTTDRKGIYVIAGILILSELVNANRQSSHPLVPLVMCLAVVIPAFVSSLSSPKITQQSDSKKSCLKEALILLITLAVFISSTLLS